MNTLTIPKTIHYCWFGKNDLPPKEMHKIMAQIPTRL